MNEFFSDMSAMALTQAIVDNAVEGCRQWAAWKPLSLYEDSESVRTMTDIPFSLFNCVLIARPRRERVEALIGEMIGLARAAGVPLAWWIAPGSQPADLAERLLARGFLHGGRTTGMAMDLSRIDRATTHVAALAIEEVRDIETLRAWNRVMTPVYEFPYPVRHYWGEMFTACGFGPGHLWRHFLARLEGRPVGTSSMFLGAGVAGISNVATVPEARGRGIGRAMTLVPLIEARRLGCRVATLFSSEMGIGIYLRIGFREYCKGNVYIWTGDHDHPIPLSASLPGR